MATEQNSNDEYIESLIREERKALKRWERAMQRGMEARGIAPGTVKAETFRDRFRWTGTEENAALASLALLEVSDESLIIQAALGLEASAMYKRLSDQQYRSQDQRKTNVLIDSFLWMHARLFVAGRLAEREARRRRNQKRKHERERRPVTFSHTEIAGLGKIQS